MRKILATGENICLSCGTGQDGAIIDYETERNEPEPSCDWCEEDNERVMSEICLICSQDKDDNGLVICTACDDRGDNDRTINDVKRELEEGAVNL